MFNDTIFIYDDFPTDDDQIITRIANPRTKAWDMTGEGIAWKTDVHQKFDADSIVENSTEDGTFDEKIGLEVQVPPNWQYGIDKLGTREDLFYRSESSEYQNKRIQN